MRPARPSARRTVYLRISPRKSVINRRSVRRSTRKPKRWWGVLKAFLTVSVTLLVLGVGIWLLVTIVVLPHLVFTKRDSQVIAYLSKHDTSQGWLLRLQPNWRDSEILRLTNLDTASGMSEKFLSLQLGLLVHEVVQVAVKTDAATVQLPVESIGQRILNTQDQPLRRIEQLRMVAKEQVGTLRSISGSEFRAKPVLPIVDPVLGARCPVAVMNTTTIAGMAEELSAVLERSGVLVVRTASGREEVPATRLRIHASMPSECLVVADQLQNAFGLEVQETSEGSQIEFEQYRAEILLELGSDWQTKI